MNAFEDGRLGVWHTSIASFKPTDGITIDGYRALGVTDIFMDPDEVDPNKPTVVVNGRQQPNYMLTPTLMQGVRNAGFKPQIYIDGTHTTDGLATAKRASGAITRLSHSGAVQINVEGPNDDTLAKTFFDVVVGFRALRPTFVLALNIVGRKGYLLDRQQPQPDGSTRSVLDLIANDQYTYIRVQITQGNMEGEDDPRLLEDDVVDRGFPKQRFSFTYPAKTQWGTCGLPGFFQRKPRAPIAKRGDIFNANLLRELGLA
jgi:hypothetical protein